MKNKSRRFEVLLPARFNDGTDVPDEVLGAAIDEIVEHFHAASYYQDAAEDIGDTTTNCSMTALVYWWSMSRTPRSIANG